MLLPIPGLGAPMNSRVLKTASGRAGPLSSVQSALVYEVEPTDSISNSAIMVNNPISKVIIIILASIAASYID